MHVRVHVCSDSYMYVQIIIMFYMVSVCNVKICTGVCKIIAHRATVS